MTRTRESRHSAAFQIMFPFGRGAGLSVPFPKPSSIAPSPTGTWKSLNSSLVETPSLWTAEIDDEVYTDSAQSGILYAWIDPNGPSWQDYTFRGRIKILDAADSVAAHIYSKIAAGGEKRGYRLVRRAGSGFVLEGYGGAQVTLGTPGTGVTPVAGTLYAFAIRADTETVPPIEEGGASTTRTRLRARVWPDSAIEPTSWQADCYDESAGRSESGTVAFEANL